MSAPAIIILLLQGSGLLISAYQHGKPQTGTHNFWSTLVSTAIVTGLLFWGGFFS